MRQLLRFPALGLVSLALLPVGLAARLLSGLGRERDALRLAAWTQRQWARGLLCVLAVDVALEGTRPPGVFLIVANHLSYLDILVLAALFPGRFVAKSEIAGWPVLGQLSRVAGTIFLVQEKRRDVLRVEGEIARTLAAGVSVLLFPEGHSTRGRGVDRLHGALLEGAVRGRIPCLAVALSYETPRDPWAPAATVCWWGGMTFLRHAWSLVGLRGVGARVRVASGPRVGEERKALAEALHADLLERFVPVRQEPIAPDFPWPEIFGLEPPAERTAGPGSAPQERGTFPPRGHGRDGASASGPVPSLAQEPRSRDLPGGTAR